MPQLGRLFLKPSSKKKGEIMDLPFWGKLSLFIFGFCFAVPLAHSGDLESPLLLKCSVRSCQDIERPSNTRTWCSADVLNGEPLQISISDSHIALINSFHVDAAKIQTHGPNLTATFSDGDQIWDLSFSAWKLKQFKSHRGKILRSRLKEGYYYDNLHFRYQLSLNCQRQLNI